MTKLLPWLSKNWFWLLVALVVLAGVSVRLWRFGSVPVSLYWDEMALWDDALSVAATGRDMHGRSGLQPLFISYGDYKLPVYIWLTIPMTWLTQNHQVGVRLVSLLAGLSMLPALWLLMGQWTRSRRVQGVALAALAVLPWSLHFSRVGFEGHLGSALVLWSLVFLFAWRQPPASLVRKIGLALVLLLFSVAAFYTYFSVRFVWPVLFIGAILIWWSDFRAAWRWLAVIGLAWCLALIPMFRADFYAASNLIRLSTTSVLNQPERPHTVNLYRQRAGNGSWTRLVFSQRLFMVHDVGRNLLEYLDPAYLFAHGDANLRHGNGLTGLTWWATAPLLVMGLVYLWQKDKRLLLFVSIWWLSGTLPAAVPLDGPHALRSLNVLPILPLLTAWGVWHVHQSLPRWGRYLIFGVMVAGVTFEFLRYTNYYFAVYPVVSAAEWQDGYHQLAKFIAQEHGHYAEVMVNIHDDRFFLYYLPYSDETWSEIQEAPTDGFKREHLKNIWFEPQGPIEVNKASVLNITNSDRPLEGGTPKQVITGANGEPCFIAYD